jgi:hypothetical protein
VRDLWSPPPARARVRRLQNRLEALLPGPLRPTRRMLRRLIKPEGPGIIVHQTWGLDLAVRVELRNLLSRHDDIGVVSVDEPMRDPVESYTRVSFGLRVGRREVPGSEEPARRAARVCRTTSSARNQRSRSARGVSPGLFSGSPRALRRSIVISLL